MISPRMEKFVENGNGNIWIHLSLGFFDKIFMPIRKGFNSKISPKIVFICFTLTLDIISYYLNYFNKNEQENKKKLIF